MSQTRLIHWSGLAAMLGGALWSAFSIAVAFRTEGCIDAECDMAGRSMRDYGDLAPVLAAAVLLMAVGLVGLVIVAHIAGRFGTLGRIGLLIGALGAATLAISLLVQAIFFNGDFSLMPSFVIPGGLALVIGFLLFGIALLQVLPHWVGALLIVGVFAMLGANDQNARVLLLVPFGIAWIAVGYVMWRGNANVTSQS